MAAPAAQIVVSIVDANDANITPKPVTFKPSARTTDDIITKGLERVYGTGLLLDKDGDAVLPGQLVTAGNYTYRVAAAAAASTAAVAPTAEAAATSSGSGGVSAAGGPGLVTTATVTEDGLEYKVLQGLTAVAKAVQSASLTEPFLKLPHVSRAIPPPLRTSIYVRDDYRKVIERMCIPTGGMTTFEEEDEQTPELPSPDDSLVPESSEEFVGTVLTGPPGCGKSSMAPLVMAHLAQNKRILVYRYEGMGLHGAGEEYVLMDFTIEPPLIGIERGSTSGISAYLHNKDPAWLLWDGPPTKAQFRGSGPVFIMSSPNDENYHEFIKGRGAAVLHLNPWSIDEFLTLADALRKKRDWALQRYRIFGGVPRPALTDQRRTLNHLKAEVSGAEADQLLDPSHLSMRGKFSHTLVHVMSDSDFQPKYLTLASPEVRRILFEKGYRYNRQRMEKLVVGGVGQPGGAAAFAGYMFEQHGHYLFTEAAGDLRVDMKQLQPPERLEVSGKRRHLDADIQGSEDEGEEEGEDEQPSHHLQAEQPSAGAAHAAAEQLQGLSVAQQGMVGTMTLPKVKHEWDSPGKSIAELREVYLQPSTANNVAWDAYYANGDQRYVLQYTASSRHGIKQQSLVALLTRLKLKEDEVKMVFVLPELPTHLYDSFSWQPWLGVRGRRLVGRKFQMEQWVMRVPMLTPNPKEP